MTTPVPAGVSPQHPLAETVRFQCGVLRLHGRLWHGSWEALPHLDAPARLVERFLAWLPTVSRAVR